MSMIKNPSRPGWMILGIVVTVVLVSVVATMTTIAYAGTAGSAVPAGPKFDDSSFEVLPASLVSLHWIDGSGTPSDRYFLITSTLPRFSSSSVVTWPSGTSPSPEWTGSDWTTTADAMRVAIPGDAAAGTRYTVALATCDSAGCSTRETMVLTVPPSTASWASRSYRSDYTHLTEFAAPGEPFATTFLPSDNSSWTASEFSHALTEIKNNGTSADGMEVVTPKGASPIFQKPFTLCGTLPCTPSDTSAESEQVITVGGKIWLTFGGWRWDRDSTPANHSEVVEFDPTTRKFCTYLVPGNNNEVAGIAATGAGTDTRVWFVESRGAAGHAYLDGFDPSAVGRGCDGHVDEAYELPASVRLLKWPASGGQWPAQVVADPTSPTLWISNFDGYKVGGTMFSDIEQLDISDPAKPTVESRYVIASANSSSLLGPKPWDIVAPAHSNYVYAIDNGDAELVRIDKVTKRIDELSIPLTSDVENAFGLAISSGRLYFTLADDSVHTFDTASTFGYIDLSSWQQGSSHADGVIYTGLPAFTDPGTKADFRVLGHRTNRAGGDHR